MVPFNRPHAISWYSSIAIMYLCFTFSVINQSFIWIWQPKAGLTNTVKYINAVQAGLQNAHRYINQTYKWHWKWEITYNTNEFL